MSDAELKNRIETISELAAFNNWLGLSVDEVTAGSVQLSVNWRKDFGQYAGFMHAGIQGALIDTACGFAAVTLSGRVLASQYSVRCLRPAVGEHFRVVARVVKPGRQQVFASAELYASKDGVEKLVATGDALLVPQAE
ncbi:PaaI family thioesterase [uncultured Marinobacter sp.]|uniref:PaaI family thioesterase n=1 Tax=uncultured Marinobacter sp. TaxID=187379 RepID=UPI0030DB9FBE